MESILQDYNHYDNTEICLEKFLHNLKKDVIFHLENKE
jgi:hypothetical protein